MSPHVPPPGGAEGAGRAYEIGVQAAQPAQHHGPLKASAMHDDPTPTNTSERMASAQHELELLLYGQLCEHGAARIFNNGHTDPRVFDAAAGAAIDRLRRVVTGGWLAAFPLHAWMGHGWEVQLTAPADASTLVTATEGGAA